MGWWESMKALFCPQAKSGGSITRMRTRLSFPESFRSGKRGAEWPELVRLEAGCYPTTTGGVHWLRRGEQG
jgi:hypothetical protein